jgi:hypothetical protein
VRTKNTAIFIITAIAKTEKIRKSLSQIFDMYSFQHISTSLGYLETQTLETNFGVFKIIFETFDQNLTTLYFDIPLLCSYMTDEQ